MSYAAVIIVLLSMLGVVWVQRPLTRREVRPHAQALSPINKDLYGTDSLKEQQHLQAPDATGATLVDGSATTDAGNADTGDDTRTADLILGGPPGGNYTGIGCNDDIHCAQGQVMEYCCERDLCHDGGSCPVSDNDTHVAPSLTCPSTCENATVCCSERKCMRTCGVPGGWRPRHAVPVIPIVNTSALNSSDSDEEY
mmetsp:Transcript_141481/g.257126  ORF Transcript_141481/g.257126 Transcript_141481/m.257126 type:complete len:197 (-) Transcript_141481:108-698(-)